MADKIRTDEDAQFYSELLRAYFDSANDAIFVLCDEMKFLTCNKMTEQWLGCTENDLTRHNQRTPITELFGENYDAKMFSSYFSKAMNGSAVSFETFISPAMGAQRWAEINLTKVDVEDGDMVIAIARDISERKQHLEIIEYQTHYDSLTGLPNMASLTKYLLAEKGDLILFTLSLERFHEVNESIGHQAADIVLVEISRRLQLVANHNAGEFVARIGGVKFALAIPRTEDGQVRDMAQSIRQLVVQPISTQKGNVSLDCGIGIAHSPIHSVENIELLQSALEAMYIARSQKLGVSIYNPEAEAFVSERLQMVADLRDAFKDGHIRAFYQPIIHMESGDIHLEALARWQRSENDFVPPDEFIYIAEENGMAHQLTSTIMNSFFDECSELIHSGKVKGLSVNLSPYCLSNTQLADEIDVCLKQYDIPPASLTLELTESFVASNLSLTNRIMQSLHQLGVSLSIDDFGTGYSSLSKLKQMTLKELKIDKSFILDINRNEDDAAITYASIQMAHGLGLEVVAEGIEDEATWERLKEMGCDYGQGFWMARPMSYEKLVSWLDNQ